MGNIWIICPEINNDDNKQITSHKDSINDQKTKQNEEVNLSNFNNDDDNDNIISKNDQKTNQNEEVNLSNNNFNNDDDNQKTNQNEEVNLNNYNFNNDDDSKKNVSGISFEKNINPIGTYEYNGKKFNKYSLEQFQENNFKW